MIGGILMTVGIEGFLKNAGTFHARADAETIAWQRFIEAWWTIHAHMPVDAGTLYPLAVDMLPDVLGDGSDRSQRIRLGKALAKRVGWVFLVDSADTRAHQVRVDGTELTDPQERRRNAWALVRQDAATDIGTLGRTSGNAKLAPSLAIPKVEPMSQCPSGLRPRPSCPLRRGRPTKVRQSTNTTCSTCDWIRQSSTSSLRSAPGGSP